MQATLPMPNFILECPQCETRFQMKRYEPDHRLRCRKCRAMLRVPIVPEHMTPEQKAEFLPKEAVLPPEIEAKLLARYSVKRMLLTSGILVAALVAAFGVLVLKATSRETREKIERRSNVVTFDSLAQSAATSLAPIGKSAEWSYRSGEKTEDRRVSGSSMSADFLPVFEMSTAPGTREAWRYGPEGIHLLEIIRGGERLKLVPPVQLLKVPLVGDDAWEHQGDLVQPGGRAQAWRLKFTTALDVADVPAGKFRCVKVVVDGTRGGEAFHEEQWYAPGVGLVRRVAGDEDWKLARYAIK